MQRDQRTDDGCKDKVDKWEHIVLLRFEIGKKENNAAQKPTKAHNGNNKKGKAMHKQLIDHQQQNTAPNRNFNGLANAVELYKIGGESKRPYDIKTKNNDNAP